MAIAFSRNPAPRWHLCPPRPPQIWEEMEARDVAPDVITYSSLIHACAVAGEWQQALAVFRAMEAAGVEPALAPLPSPHPRSRCVGGGGGFFGVLSGPQAVGTHLSRVHVILHNLQSAQICIFLTARRSGFGFCIACGTTADRPRFPQGNHQRNARI